MIRLRDFIVVSFLFYASIASGKKCNISETLVKEVCDKNEDCYELRKDSDAGICNCTEGYVRRDTVCVLEENAVDAGNHWGLSLLLTVTFLALVIMAVYFSRKYKILSWLRYKINQRYSGGYDDAMIGQDDD